MELKQKLKNAYELLQGITIVTTEKNINAVAYALAAIKEAYQKIDDSMKKDVKEETVNHIGGETNGKN